MVIARMILGFPAVKAQLAKYKEYLRLNPGPLSRQGLDSIRDKAFHCLGGSVYAYLAAKEQRRDVLTFIIAFQTISDYLDNLCDRFGVHSQQVFRQLHTAMLDALNPDATEFCDYYSLFPARTDGGYLQMLVSDCRRSLSRLPEYSKCRDQVVELTELYIHLQSFKHMERKAGEELLSDLFSDNAAMAPGLFWWEFAAACGSTLGVFTMVAAGSNSRRLFMAYMPWINGLHILLDYFIDQEEDVEHNDMNLVSYYDRPEYQVKRLLWFYRQARGAARGLERRRFHAVAIDGLLALYLSDPKARSPKLAGKTATILQHANLRTRILEGLARILRNRGVI